jgi:hypothetical protein
MMVSREAQESDLVMTGEAKKPPDGILETDGLSNVGVGAGYITVNAGLPAAQERSKIALRRLVFEQIRSGAR